MPMAMPRLSGGRLSSGPTVFFVLSGLAAIGAAALVYQLALKASPRVSVVVARQPIAPYTQLTDNMLAVVMLPEAAVPDGALQAVAGARGRWTNRSFLPGDVVRQGHLSQVGGPGGALAEKLADPTHGRPQGVAISLPMELSPGLAARLEPGDRVDILAYFRDDPVTPGGRPGTAAAPGGVFVGPVARGALVLDVVADEGTGRGGEVVVAVAPEEALGVLQGLSKGRVLLALHPAGGAGAAQPSRQ